jgi:DNA-binding transcriptional LysR family regulator
MELRHLPMVAVPANDPLANRSQATWRDLDGREAIALEHCDPYQRQMDEALAVRGVTLRTIQRADSTEAALAFVGVGLGIALVHEFVATTSSADVVFVQLPADAGEHELGAMWRRSGIHPLRERFLETVASIAIADSLQRISA